MAKKKASPEPAAATEPVEYTVVARRYRPQQFAELIGQSSVAQALSNAITSDRVAHAYLFTGTRGVGKTTAARILAKCLNCEKGPTPTPCDKCESCLAIAGGDDVDVLEIDGASNRGIDAIRDLRQNVQFRPTRGRYKIYVIDEVHMLTREAFNALLKTLEEPPSHVKFIFATTDVEKIPITILSRCQRFDFGSIKTPLIRDQLKTIVKAEGRTADDAALAVIARRGQGSMRDAESLLEQLLSFGPEHLTAEHVHQLLGSAPEECVRGVAVAIAANDPKAVIASIEDALQRGTHPGELLDQITEAWRDSMLIASGATDGNALNFSQEFHAEIRKQGFQPDLDAILAGLDILTLARSRLRGSSHPRVILEVAALRLGRIGQSIELAELLQQMNRGGAAAAPAADPTSKKKPEVSVAMPTSAAASPSEVTLDKDSVAGIWAEILQVVGPMLAGDLKSAGLPAISGPNCLVLRFPSDYNRAYESCSASNRIQRLEAAALKLTGKAWTVRCELAQSSLINGSSHSASAETRAVRAEPVPNRALHPLVETLVKTLSATVLGVDANFGDVPEAANGSSQIEADNEDG